MIKSVLRLISSLPCINYSCGHNNNRNDGDDDNDDYDGNDDNKDYGNYKKGH